MADFHPGLLRFWADLAVIALLLFLGAYAVGNRRVPAAKPFAVGAFVLAAGLICLFLEQAAGDPAAIFFWYRLHNAAFLIGATATAAFCLEYAYPGRWLTPRNLLLAAIPCVFAALVLVLSSTSGLFWRSVTIGAYVLADRTFAAVAMLAYGWALMFVNVGALGWLAARSPQHRLPVALIIGGQVVGRLIFALQYLPAVGGRSPDLIFLSAGVPFALYAVGLFGFRLFDPLPGAFAAAVQQMREGMLVFGVEGQLLNLNPAAGRILNLPAARRAGKTWPDIFPALPPPASALSEALECALGPAAAPRRYAVELTPLADQRGVRTAFLVLLHDVTELRAAQARAAELHRAAATQDERERLAREFHDGLAQALGYAKFRLQAAVDALDVSHPADARAAMIETRDALQQAHVEVRDFLLSAQPRPAAQTLAQQVDDFIAGFAAHHAFTVRTEWRTDPRGLRLSPETQMQVALVVQEAIVNAQRHSGCAGAQVEFEQAGKQLHVRVRDAGAGFAPGNTPAAGEGRPGHYGLRFMRERAEAVGGALEVTSAPGRGTEIHLAVPVARDQGGA